MHRTAVVLMHWYISCQFPYIVECEYSPVHEHKLILELVHPIALFVCCCYRYHLTTPTSTGCRV